MVEELDEKGKHEVLSWDENGEHESERVLQANWIPNYFLKISLVSGDMVVKIDR